MICVVLVLRRRFLYCLTNVLSAAEHSESHSDRDLIQRLLGRAIRMCRYVSGVRRWLALDTNNANLGRAYNISNEPVYAQTPGYKRFTNLKRLATLQKNTTRCSYFEHTLSKRSYLLMSVYYSTCLLVLKMIACRLNTLWFTD